MSSKPTPTESLVSGHGNATVTSMSECPKHVVNRDVKCPESRERETKGVGRSAAPRRAAARALTGCTGTRLPSPELGAQRYPPKKKRKEPKEPPLAVQHRCVSCHQSTGRRPSAASPSPLFRCTLAPVPRGAHASCRRWDVLLCTALCSESQKPG